MLKWPNKIVSIPRHPDEQNDVARSITLDPIFIIAPGDFISTITAISGKVYHRPFIIAICRSGGCGCG
jgi:hypothetical protein